MKRLLAPLVTALAVTVLVSCASAPSADGVTIVASTDVYGSIASEIAGNHAAVTSIINSPSQDPHEFEASARVQLELSRADIVIVNGGGYDDFMEVLLSGAHKDQASVLRAVDLSARDDAEISANEHVWYDLDTVRALAASLTETLATMDPTHAEEYGSNAQLFYAKLDDLQAHVAQIASAHQGESVLVTEPVPLYLLEEAGLTNITPVEFSTAIEGGQGVPPAQMKEVIDLLASGSIALLAYNEQTEGPETAHILAEAKTHGVSVIPVTETLPEGRDYLSWMSDNILAIAEALS